MFSPQKFTFSTKLIINQQLKFNLIRKTPYQITLITQSLLIEQMIVSFVFIIIGAFIGISQSAGIGGGPILNICLMLGLGYQSKQAMALTYIFLMGGSLASILQNYPKRKKNGYPLMDYELIELTLPMTLSGSIFGVMINHFISDFIITICFTILLTYLAYNCYQKYKESKEPQIKDLGASQTQLSQPIISSNEQVETTSHPILQSILESERSPFPKDKLKVMLYAVSTTIAMLLLRGSRSFRSIVGVEPCGIVYWILNILHFALCYLFAKSSAIKIFKVQEEKQKFGLGENSEHKMTASKFKSAMFYGFLAGAVGGALGLGGAIILVPVWLNNGTDKQVATSSSPPLIFLSSFISFFISAISGKYTLLQFFQFFALSFFSSLIVKYAITYIANKFNLKSMIYVLLIFTMGVSLVALLPFEYFNYVKSPSEFMMLGQMC